MFGQGIKILTLSSYLAGAAIVMAETPMVQAQETLSVSVLKGRAPHHVTITGPGRVLAKMENCRRGSRGWFGPGGNGLQVDWGDGNNGQELASGTGSCAEAQRSHVYAAPGTYHIRVEEWHPGPNDKPKTDWQGQATVHVTGGK